ncbi:kinase-like protein [Rhizophagus irregularis]|nr:kinase-like protein [Rhizophagus irregularis]
MGGLERIHSERKIHGNLHGGNLLIEDEKVSTDARISNVGLYGPCNYDESRSQIYGVLPYVAPEVLRGENHNTASDIYSFGIVMNTLATGKRPWYNRAHDTNLARDICDGKRLEIPDDTPKFYAELMIKAYHKCLQSASLAGTFGITKDPTSKLYDRNKNSFRRKIHRNLHGGNLLIEDEKVSARISDVGLYEPCNYDKSRSQLYGSYHMLRRNFYVAKIKVLPLTWIQDNDPGKRPTASYLNENLEEWIILICDDPNPSKISGKNSILLSGIFGTTSIVMNLCQYLDHHNLLIVSKDARIGDMDQVTMMEAYWYTKKWSFGKFG